jgi:hypothetical protein
MKTGTELIAEERQRQIDQEGYTPEHDDEHDDGEIAIAGACYALAGAQMGSIMITRHEEVLDERSVDEFVMEVIWPWDRASWKPSEEDPIRDLVKAGALIAAEIDRLQRAERRFQEEGWRSQL